MRRASLLVAFGVVGCSSLYGVTPTDQRDAPKTPDAPAGSGSSVDAPVDDGLVVHYTLDAIGSGEPCVSDATGQHDAYCVPGMLPQVIAGEIGNGFRFTSDSDLDPGQGFTTTPTGALANMAQLTVALWLRPSPGGHIACVVNRTMGATSGNAWQICTDHADEQSGSDDQLHVYCAQGSDGNGGGDLDYTIPSPGWDGDGAGSGWHHVAFTWDGSAGVVYLDGAAVKAGPLGIVQGSDDTLTFGRDLDPTPNAALAGDLDDIRIYDRQLSSAEISALAGP